MPESRRFQVYSELTGKTLAAALKQVLPGISWSQARRMVATRRVRIGGYICLDESRRLKEGEIVEVLEHSLAPLPRHHDVPIIHRDQHLLVIDKPPGILTERRHEERRWTEDKKQRSPSLDELLSSLVKKPPLSVHRLDRDTSGLMLFALTIEAQSALIHRFKSHKINRTYLAVVHGIIIESMTIDAHLVRDCGDGLRGSGPQSDPTAQRAITHVRPIETIANCYTLVECRLQTGRTHQIRVHLAESDHMLCGETTYTRPHPGLPAIIDNSRAPRIALHSHNLRFTHPVTKQELHFTSPLSADLSKWLAKLRAT